MKRHEGEQTVIGIVLAAALICTTAVTDRGYGQLVLNEANCVGEEALVQTDLGKPYEGYDFGVVPHSGNNNPPNHPTQPGNPFPADVDGGVNVSTMLPNGWDLNNNPLGWARVLGNGGDWIELVVTEDHTDLRGYTLYWENDDAPLDGMIGTTPDERGFIKLTGSKEMADLRAGTIITISENAIVNELRDQYPVGLPYDEGGLDPHDTGFDYDLSTDTGFDPFENGDWHVHLFLDESITSLGTDTAFFAGFSDIRVDNDDWQMYIFDSSNTAVVEEAGDASVSRISDLTTGLIQGPVGEAQSDWGANTGGSGVNNQELMALTTDPATGLSSADYEDVDFSTFGTPNMYNDLAETTLDGVQDFSDQRNPVLANTHDWVASGTADFNSATNWVNADSGATPGTGPQSTWTVRLSNDAGGDNVAQVSANATVEFASIMATSGSMTLDVQPGTALTIQGAAQPGRALVMDGGQLIVNGTLEAAVVEAFSGATIGGTGTLEASLHNTGGLVAPGNSTGTLTVVGDYVQNADGTLGIELSGTSAGEFDALNVTTTATLDGRLEIDLGGFSPALGNTFRVITSAGITDNGLTLAGDAVGFTMLTIGGTDLVLSRTFHSPDFDADGDLDNIDVDALVAEIVAATNASPFDLSGDGLVDPDDLDAWLAAAGSINLASGNPYLTGDANLDGTVDGQDFVAWNSNKFEFVAAWTAGDFNADGIVDGQDFVEWNSHKFMTADQGNQVPEPTSLWLGALALLLTSISSRRR